MMNKLNSLRKSKAGFTLVELIVVLIILAILAALLIPALTGYIDEAREKEVVVEARMCVLAAQTLYTEYYALNGAVDAATLADWWNDSTTGADKEEFLANFAALAEISNDQVTNLVKNVTIEDNKVATLDYVKSDELYCSYANSNYVVHNSKYTDPTDGQG